MSLISLKSLFYRLLTTRENITILNSVFIKKIISSLFLENEVKIIDNIIREVGHVSRSFHLDPRLLGNYIGLDNAFLDIYCCKAHSRTVSYILNGDKIRCEIGDLIFVVEYEINMLNISFCIDKKVTIVQLKRRQANGWIIDGAQFYLMKMWPNFVYKSKIFNLKLFRLYPDLGSFYCH